jgi:hypothetical protein
MDDATAGPRIQELRHKITQLKAHRDDLAASLDAEPAPPPPGTIERLRAYLHHTIAEGTSGERKRAIEALVAEIRINQEGRVTPIFKIPGLDAGIVIDDAGIRTATQPTGVRNGEVGGVGGTRTRTGTDLNRLPPANWATTPGPAPACEPRTFWRTNVRLASRGRGPGAAWRRGRWP